jgi:hypothetical protein
MSMVKSDKNFYELTKHLLSNASELNLFGLLKDTSDNTYLHNIFRNYIINETTQTNSVYFLTHEVEEVDFPDTIAVKYYENPNLWWVICLFNNIINPFEELTSGDNLKILRPNYLYQLLREISTIGAL